MPRRLRILIAPDKFKGTLSAAQAARAISIGWLRARPQDRIHRLPISDGGDGFGPVLAELLHAQPRSLSTVNAAHQTCRSTWWWSASDRTAIVESARLIGLAMLPRGKFHPFDLDTFGLGKALLAAANAGAQQCLVGVGGSATNDGGFGLALALGWSFLDPRGKPILRWPDLRRLARVVPPSHPRLPGGLRVALDVRNPLLGPQGASRIYGPQKGLRPEDMAEAESALRKLARCTAQTLSRDLSKTPGAGAAGGLGFGLMAFAGARPEPGFDLIAHAADLDRHLDACDLLVTGEGSLDQSTPMGKGVGELAARAAARNIPCLGIAGIVQHRARLKPLFAQTTALVDLTTASESMRHPALWLARASERLAQTIRSSASLDGLPRA